MIFIEHLHLNKFVYRDLKPNNVIFDINKTTIIFDFDRMIGCKENVSDTIVTTQDFSHLYVAPEVVSGQHFSYEADIYSLGLVIYFIFFGKPPPLKNIIDSETSEFDFDKFDDDFTIFRKICEDCTCKIPNKRPRLSNIINIVFTNFCYFSFYRLSFLSFFLPDTLFISRLKIYTARIWKPLCPWRLALPLPFYPFPRAYSAGYAPFR